MISISNLIIFAFTFFCYQVIEGNEDAAIQFLVRFSTIFHEHESLAAVLARDHGAPAASSFPNVRQTLPSVCEKVIYGNPSATNGEDPLVAKIHRLARASQEAVKTSCNRFMTWLTGFLTGAALLKRTGEQYGSTTAQDQALVAYNQGSNTITIENSKEFIRYFCQFGKIMAIPGLPNILDIGSATAGCGRLLRHLDFIGNRVN